MPWIFYNLLFFFGYLLVLPHFLLRMRRRGGYRKHFLQRFGIYRPDIRLALAEGGRTWVHAVSVGELFVALRFIQVLREKDPSTRFVLSVTTSTAFAIAERELPADDVLVYFPVDFPWVMRKVLRLVQPRAIALLEGELWPNFIRLAHRRGIPVAVINGRMSEKSYRGYRKVRIFTRKLLPMLSALYLQGLRDKERFLNLGAPQSRIKVLGSAKYDVADSGPSEEDVARAVIHAAGIADDELVLLGGSTWPGEELALARAYRKLLERDIRCALVLVPRHVERTVEVIEQLEADGFKVRLRSELKEGRFPKDINDPYILIVNTTGELKAFYSCADIIFVGKSLTQHGGQNIIEPAVYGKPVLVGPNMENFPLVTEDFLAAKACIQVPSAAVLETEIFELAVSREKREQLGSAARRLVTEKRGSLTRTAEDFLELTSGA